MHFAIGGYFLFVPLLALLSAPAHASAESVARLVMRISLIFLAGLGIVTSLAVPVALVLDRPLRRQRRNEPAARSSAQVEAAARIALDDPLDATVARIAAARWDHDDPRFQALSRDLGEVVRAAMAALASAPPERRGAIIDRTGQALARLENELGRLVASRANADERQVDVLSNYLDARYPAHDSPLRPD